MVTETNSTADDQVPDRWKLIRDILVLQLKLVFDGMRDFILVPISLIIGIISLLNIGGTSGNNFYKLLRTGRRSEHWINLFGAAERVYGPLTDDDRFPTEDIDKFVSRVESFVIDEYSKGGVTRQAKIQLDRALDSLHKLASSKGKNSTDT